MGSSKPNQSIAVDLLAVLPGGANGGAKLLALDLIKGLLHDYAITCFCQPFAEAEIAAYLGDKVRIICVEHEAVLHAAYDAQVAANGPFAVNFFPMQRVSLHRVGTPCISIVHDLQFADLPGNFSPSERAERTAALGTCIEHSDLIVTVSHFSKSRIEAIAGIDSRRIRVILNALSSAPGDLSICDTQPVRPTPYFLYPANFWPHKNHAGLVEAYRAYRKAVAAPLDLVLTGEQKVATPELVLRLSVEPGIVMTGYVDRDEFLRLLVGATALVFPSLYEGFGMPIVEAMAVNIPVACSNAGSLPEIAGEAALIFDGEDCDAIAEAMVRLASDATLRAALIASGRLRVAELGGFAVMRNAYRNVLEELLAEPVSRPPAIRGVDADGWAAREVTIALPETREADRVQLQLSLPAWVPLSRQILAISSGDRSVARRTLWPSEARSINLQLRPGEHSLAVTAVNDFRLSDVLDAPVRHRVAFRLEGAAYFANGRRMDLWPPAAQGASFCDIALVVFEGAPEKGITVTAVCATAQPVTIRLLPALANDDVTFESSPEPLMSNVPAARIDVPPSAGLPSLRFPEGIGAISFRKNDPAAPAIIEDRQTEAGFSVIIPSFNQGRFIGRTIDSVLIQDHVHEVLVLDGGSTDETLDVLADYGSRIAWSSRRDGGQADAVNQGLARAQGEYVAWINSDDTYSPGAFAHAAQIFAACVDVGVVYGDADHIDENDRFIEPYPTAGFDATALRERCFICQPAAFFRRRLVVRHGGLRASLRYCLDYEFWLRLSANGVTFEQTRQLLAHSRMYAANKTMGERLHAYFETADMMIRSIGHSDGKWIEHFANAAADLLGSNYGIPRAFALREARQLGQAIWSSGIGKQDRLFAHGLDRRAKGIP